MNSSDITGPTRRRSRSARPSPESASAPGLSIDDAVAKLVDAAPDLLLVGQGAQASSQASVPASVKTPDASSLGEPEPAPARTPEPPQPQSAPVSTEPVYQPGLYRVNERGEGELIPADEVEKIGLMRDDYTKKSMALAEERKQYAAEQAALKAEREMIAADKARLVQALRANTPAEPDWEAEYAADPSNFATKHAAWTIRQQQISRADQEAQKAQETLSQERFNAERAKVLELIPTWQDAAVATKEWNELTQFATAQGYTQQDIVNGGARTVVNLRRAMLFEKQALEAPAQQAKIQAKIDRVKVAAPGSAQAPTTAPTQIDRDYAKLKQSRKVSDAAAVLAHVFK